MIFIPCPANGDIPNELSSAVTFQAPLIVCSRMPNVVGGECAASLNSCLMLHSCEAEAANALAEKIARRPVTCEDLGRDRYKRTIARCTVAGEDLEKWLAANGWALAYRRYSFDYVDEEADARAARRGIWAGEFVKPWEWRRGKRLETTAPEA